MVNWKSRLRALVLGLHAGGLYRLRDRLRRWNPRRLAGEARFRRWNRGAAAGEMVVRPGLALRVEPRARESFEWFCFRSPEMVREMDAFVRQMRSRRRFLDIGACHGIFSLAFAHGRPEAMALAIEPSGLAFEILAANVAAQELANIVPRQIACGAAAGTLRMRQVWHHLEAVSGDELADGAGVEHVSPIAGEPRAPRAAAEGEVIAAPMITVDALCVEMDFPPDLVKIDVEGYELEVLSGARDTLARHRPLLFLEVHPDRLRQLGHALAEVVRMLESLGYGFSELGGAALSGRQVAALRNVSRLVCAAD
jgi:FkbM family methyltransferase